MAKESDAERHARLDRSGAFERNDQDQNSSRGQTGDQASGGGRR